MSKQKWRSIVLLALMIGQVFLLTSIATNLNDQTSNSNNNGLSGINDNSTSPNLVNPNSSDASTANTWWNNTYTHRILINITEPNIYQRTNEPVSINLTFTNGMNHYNTTQLVQYYLGSWTPVQSQISNIVYYSGNIYVESYTITFLVTINQGQSKNYYVYYCENALITQTFSSSLQTTLSNGQLSVNNGHYQVGLKINYGYSSLVYDGINFHTNDSMSPLSTIAPASGVTYSPDSNGFIDNWLVVGAFNEQNNFAEPSSLLVDASTNYVQGDTVTYGNGNYQWQDATASSSSVIDFNSIYGTNNRRDYSAYSLMYVYTPTDLNNIYVKITACSGMGIIMDHTDSIFYQAPSGWSNQNYATYDAAYGGPFDMSAGWHTFLVYTLHQRYSYSNNWGFRLRFSTDSNTGSLTDPGALTNLTVSLAPHTMIQSITQPSQNINGSIYSSYDVSWAQSSDMSVSDHLTFYAGTSMYECQRTFSWTYPKSTSADNNSFSVLNTNYPSTYFQEYLYDGQASSPLSNNQFTSQNYTLTRDIYDNYNLVTLGVFISNITTTGTATLSNLQWQTAYSSGSPGSINMIPGNQTDLYTPGAGSSVTVTFWEYVDSGIGAQYSDTAALTTANGIYNSLKNPLQTSIGQSENLFFNLDVNCKDHDGQNAPGVNVTIYNSTSQAFVTSLNTSSNGIASFSRLLEYNYTLNVTYTNFGQTLFLKTVNVNLNDSKSIVIDNLNLTTLDLYLQNWDQYSNDTSPIIGARVDFYSNSGAIVQFIGSETSDSSGLVSFYWSNESQSIMNYTFSVFFLDANNPKLINTTSTNQAYNITTPLESFTSLTVSVKVGGSYQTYLNINTKTVMDQNTWGDTLTINASYWYVIGTGSPTAISQASVSYSLQSSYGEVTSGVLTGNGTTGYYTADIDTSAVGMSANTPYNLYITASKSGYTPATNSSSITLKSVTMTLLPNTNSIDVYWNQNITLGVRLNDTYNNQPISDASVTYGVAQLPSIQGQLERDTSKGAGWYNITLNSTEFVYSGSYQLTVQAIKGNYTTTSIILPITIMKIQTLLNGTIFLQQSLKMYVTTTHNFYFNYSLPNGQGISDAAVATWELQDLDGNQGAQSISNGTLTETATPGIYEITGLNTSNLIVGQYSLVVTISQTNYVERVCAYSISINKIPMVLQSDITGNIYQKPKGQNITISLVLLDNVTKAPIIGANVSINYNGHTYKMLEIGSTGNYSWTIDTSTYKVLASADTFPAVISITYNNNYTINDIKIQVQVQPPLGPFGVPLIYWIIIGSVVFVSVAVYAISRGIVYARIPMMVKLIKSTEKSIKKKSRFTTLKITRSPQEIIEEESEDEYAILGLSLKGKLTGKGKEPSSANTDVDNIERRLN